MKCFVLLLVSLIFSGCDEPDMIHETEIIFQFEYLNHAWSFQHRGFFISNEGDILFYDKPAGWIFPEENKIKPDDLKNNLKKAVKKESKVDQKELREMISLALSVSNLNLGKAEQRMADAGSEGYFVYRLNKQSGDYDMILILQKGDWFQENDETNAKKIAEWLIGLNEGGIYRE